MNPTKKLPFFSPIVFHSSKLAIAVLVAISFLPAVTALADDDKEELPDFKATSYSFSINRYTPATAAEMEKVGKAKAVKVEVEKTCTQADLEGICSHDWIEELSIENGNEEINSLAPLTKLTKLKILDVRSPKKAKETPFDLAPLAELTDLEELDFYACPVTNTDALKGLSKLHTISFYMASVDSIKFVAGTPDLEVLDLYGFKHTFEDYKPLASLKKLRMLGVYMNKQATDENLAVLSTLTTLEEFKMSNCKAVTTLDFLSGSAASMKTLRASWCTGLTDFSALHEMVNLESLNATDLPTTDFSFIPKMSAVRTLSIKGAKISDLSIFKGLENLKSLSLGKEDVPADAEEQLKAIVPEARVSLR